MANSGKPPEPSFPIETPEEETARAKRRQGHWDKFTEIEPMAGASFPNPPAPPPVSLPSDIPEPGPPPPTWNQDSDDHDVIKVHGDSSAAVGVTDSEVQFMGGPAVLPSADPRPSVPLPAILAVAAVVLVGVVGYAATRAPSGQGDAAPLTTSAVTVPPLPTATSPFKGSVTSLPPATVPSANVVMAVTPIPGAGGVGPFGPKCPHGWTIQVSTTVSNAKPGDTVHLVLTGPGIPQEQSGVLDANLSYTTPAWPTTIGTGTWTAHVDSVGGRPAGSTTALNQETCG